MLVRGRPLSCDNIDVTQAVQVPYTIEQDKDGEWCASALLCPDVGAFGEGTTPEEAISDLRAALETLDDVVGLGQA